MTTRKIASATIRTQIIDCLKKPRGYRIYDQDQRYLDRKGLVPVKVVEDLISHFETYEIFELPKNNPQAPQKYQYVIPYDDPKLLIHVKITPMDRKPPIVFLGFHEHNTGYAPLPKIPIKKGI